MKRKLVKQGQKQEITTFDENQAKNNIIKQLELDNDFLKSRLNEVTIDLNSMHDKTQNTISIENSEQMLSE